MHDFSNFLVSQLKKIFITCQFFSSTDCFGDLAIGLESGDHLISLTDSQLNVGRFIVCCPTGKCRWSVDKKTLWLIKVKVKVRYFFNVTASVV